MLLCGEDRLDRGAHFGSGRIGLGLRLRQGDPARRRKCTFETKPLFSIWVSFALER